LRVDPYQQAADPISFMPGPIQLPAAVREAFIAEPVSHRAPDFVADVQRVKAALCARVNARYVEIFFGSATVANEALAAQLTLLPGRGLMLANGEFGVRLVEQARCWQLALDAVEMEWGKPFDYAAIEAHLAANPDITWLWFSHCETSTGLLNDLERIKALCRRYDVRCCVDCISSIGSTAIDLSGVYLATGASGKALGSYAGLGMVFYNEPVAPSDRIPRYLDIGFYASQQGVPFTLSSNLVYALAAALKVFPADYYLHIADLARQIYRALHDMQLALVVPEEDSIPAVTTIALPPAINSVILGDALVEAGYELSYKSRYLVERNWIQICLMGEHEAGPVRRLLADFATQVERLRVAADTPG
jgi:aspartate aminotransferase-like enzyme